MRVYGIKSCDTVRKAMKELEAGGHEPVLQDIREDPLQPSDLKGFLDAFGEALVNKRSTTWRGLDEAERAGDPAKLIAAHPALMKRPVVVDGETRTLGWDQAARAVWL
ncbi:MAG: arsenate reductase [Maritimibacter sp.]|uniref:arsenate reductase family protein n=1 Tax=Maritimibacter sp. TaxID=2003363 RepID=UPI001E0A77A3|nr:ArsC/Spx/MgsR family protein [Maritimibacter sp.]MBL6429223.1 arsenate reductase [Maritimibacter sp.]